MKKKASRAACHRRTHVLCGRLTAGEFLGKTEMAEEQQSGNRHLLARGLFPERSELDDDRHSTCRQKVATIADPVLRSVHAHLSQSVCVRACVRTYVRAYVRACMRACVRACVRVCMRVCACAQHAAAAAASCILLWRAVKYACVEAVSALVVRSADPADRVLDGAVGLGQSSIN